MKKRKIKRKKKREKPFIQRLAFSGTNKFICCEMLIARSNCGSGLSDNQKPILFFFFKKKKEKI